MVAGTCAHQHVRSIRWFQPFMEATPATWNNSNLNSYRARPDRAACLTLLPSSKDAELGRHRDRPGKHSKCNPKNTEHRVPSDQSLRQESGWLRSKSMTS
eukprot:5301970-Amphidinium_carterae.1